MESVLEAESRIRCPSGAYGLHSNLDTEVKVMDYGAIYISPRISRTKCERESRIRYKDRRLLGASGGNEQVLLSG